MPEYHWILNTKPAAAYAAKSHRFTAHARNVECVAEGINHNESYDAMEMEKSK